MSLHWSSSSSSGHTLSGKRTASSTCWRKTSSTRKSTPKTKETGVCRGARTLGTGSNEKGEERRATERMVWCVVS